MKIFYQGTDEEQSLDLEQQANGEVALVLKDKEGKIRSLVAVVMTNGALFRCKLRTPQTASELPIKLNEDGRIFLWN